jgi:hypothetical protein
MSVEREQRRARHEQASSPILRNDKFPSPNEGTEGQTTYVNIKGKLTQLVKSGGTWKKM